MSASTSARGGRTGPCRASVPAAKAVPRRAHSSRSLPPAALASTPADHRVARAHRAHHLDRRGLASNARSRSTNSAPSAPIETTTSANPRVHQPLARRPARPRASAACRPSSSASSCDVGLHHIRRVRHAQRKGAPLVSSATTAPGAAQRADHLGVDALRHARWNAAGEDEPPPCSRQGRPGPAERVQSSSPTLHARAG